MDVERLEVYRNLEVERLLTDIIVKKPEIIPVFDLEWGYRYIDVEESLKKKPEETREFLEKLVKVGILEGELYARDLRCPKCKSPNVEARYVCPFCSSIDVKKDALIEHVSCGYIDVMSNFDGDDHSFCPKCHGKLELGNYRSVGSWYICDSCKKRVEFPTPQHKCRRCGSIFNLDGALYEGVYSYSLSSIAKEEISHGILLRGAIKDRVVTVGYEVKVPYIVKGDSGVDHTFDMLLVKNGVKMAVDVMLSDKPISQVEVIKEYTKIIDTKEKLYLVAIPELNDDARKLADFYKIKVIETASPYSALEMLMKELSMKEETKGEELTTPINKNEIKDENTNSDESFLGILFKRRK